MRRCCVWLPSLLALLAVALLAVAAGASAGHEGKMHIDTVTLLDLDGNGFSETLDLRFSEPVDWDGSFDPEELEVSFTIMGDLAAAFPQDVVATQQEGRTMRVVLDEWRVFGTTGVRPDVSYHGPLQAESGNAYDDTFEHAAIDAAAPVVLTAQYSLHDPLLCRAHCTPGQTMFIVFSEPLREASIWDHDAWPESPARINVISPEGALTPKATHNIGMDGSFFWIEYPDDAVETPLFFEDQLDLDLRIDAGVTDLAGNELAVHAPDEDVRPLLKRALVPYVTVAGQTCPLERCTLALQPAQGKVGFETSFSFPTFTAHHYGDLPAFQWIQDVQELQATGPLQTNPVACGQGDVCSQGSIGDGAWRFVPDETATEARTETLGVELVWPWVDMPSHFSFYLQYLDGRLDLPVQIDPTAQPPWTVGVTPEEVDLTDGQSAVLELQAPSAPDQEVSMRITTTSPAIQVSRDVVTFSPDDWEEARQVVVDGDLESEAQLVLSWKTQAGPDETIWLQPVPVTSGDPGSGDGDPSDDPVDPPVPGGPAPDTVCARLKDRGVIWTVHPGHRIEHFVRLADGGNTWHRFEGQGLMHLEGIVFETTGRIVWIAPEPPRDKAEATFDGSVDLVGPGCRETYTFKVIVQWGDQDMDTIIDPWDNCPEVWNYEQSDQDDDGVGDACAAAGPQKLADGGETTGSAGKDGQVDPGAGTIDTTNPGETDPDPGEAAAQDEIDAEADERADDAGSQEDGGAARQPNPEHVAETVPEGSSVPAVGPAAALALVAVASAMRRRI